MTTASAANQHKETNTGGVFARQQSPILFSMRTFASLAVGLLMLGTLGMLFAGLIGMARGVSGATSNRFMRYRVLLQGAALLLLMLFMSILKG